MDARLRESERTEAGTDSGASPKPTASSEKPEDVKLDPRIARHSEGEHGGGDGGVLPLTQVHTTEPACGRPKPRFPALLCK